MGRLTGTWYRLHAGLTRNRIRWVKPAHPRTASRWLVLQSGPNPSTDYYIRPRAAAAGIAATYRDIEHDMPSAADLADGTQVIVVRYLNRRWAEALRARAGALAGVVYFMDDDLLDPAAWRGLPAAYRDRLARHCATMSPHIAAPPSPGGVATPAAEGRIPV